MFAVGVERDHQQHQRRRLYLEDEFVSDFNQHSSEARLVVLASYVISCLYCLLDRLIPAFAFVFMHSPRLYGPFTRLSEAAPGWGIAGRSGLAWSKSTWSPSDAFRNLPMARVWICRIRSLDTPMRGPDLLQGERRLAAGEAETTRDNLQLPLIQTAKDLFTCDSREAAPTPVRTGRHGGPRWR